MSFLTGIEIRRRIESGDIEIHSLDANEPFNIDGQVTEDSIDLRLAPIALRARHGTAALDYLDPDLPNIYESDEIPALGVELQPLEPLLTQTLEMVCLPDSLIGMVVTRSTFARMGLMTTCMAPKFATGIRWAFPLQIVNLNRFPVRIYPYAPMVQLLVAPMIGETIGYRGRYQDSSTPTPPLVSERERASLSQMNPAAVNRTFHIINQDFRSRRAAPANTSTEGAVSKHERARPPHAKSNRAKALKTSIQVIISTIAAAAFGLAGNLLSGGSMSYWQTFCLVLLILIGALLSGISLAVQQLWRIQVDGDVSIPEISTDG